MSKLGSFDPRKFKKDCPQVNSHNIIATTSITLITPPMYLHRSGAANNRRIYSIVNIITQAVSRQKNISFSKFKMSNENILTQIILPQSGKPQSP